VETIGTLDRYLAAGCHRQRKRRTQGGGGPPPTDGRPAVPFLHPARDTVVRNQARTMLQVKPLKDGRVRNATREWETEAQDDSYILEARGHSTRPSGSQVLHRAGEVSDWILWRSRPPPRRKKRRPKHWHRKGTKMMAVHLDRLASYQGTARDERP
jgi:hypothetical protein